MEKLAQELKGKLVHIVFLHSAYSGGGVAAAKYEVLGVADGFLKLCDGGGNILYCNLASVGKIKVAGDGGKGENTSGGNEKCRH